MTYAYDVQRYGSYFGNWCQSFGIHDTISNEKSGIYWLISEHQVGISLQHQLRKQLFKEVLRKKHLQVFFINEAYAQIGNFHYPFSGMADKQGYDAIRKILASRKECHLFLTSHFAYGTSTRILTLSDIKPLYIMYKEIGHIQIQLD
jgi:hypothetical protein